MKQEYGNKNLLINKLIHIERGSDERTTEDLI